MKKVNANKKKIHKKMQIKIEKKNHLRKNNMKKKIEKLK
jgi:hypothetical protein